MPKGQADFFESTDNPALAAQQLNLKKTRRIYTVSELTQDVKLVLENTFAEVWVEGEVSGLSRIATGTIFWSLKDSNSLLKCVMFHSFARALKFEIKDGMNLVCFGKVSVYEKDGKYQLYAQEIEPKGVGSLQLALEQLKVKLEKEGLFAIEHKKPIPYLPSRIGVVTSISGAAIKDILKVLETRFKDIHIVINPVRVQGEGAKEEIALAIEEFNLLNERLPKGEGIEVMIVGRGGGSAEDLWAFNEEIVARAIYKSKIPVISAVGHERDWSVADLVADRRAPTPSVAAELVIPKKEELTGKIEDLNQALKNAFLEMATGLQEDIDQLAHRLKLNIEHILELNAGRFSGLSKKLSLLNPCVMIRQYMLKTVDLARQIYIRIAHLVELKQSRLTKNIEKLSSLSPLNILSRGYSIVFKLPEGTVIKDINSVQSGDMIKTKLHRGEILSQVKELK